MDIQEIVGKVAIGGSVEGTCFLLDEGHVATALHVLDGNEIAMLSFPSWKQGTQRIGNLWWKHPLGHDIAILKLDIPAPGCVELFPTRQKVEPNDRWSSFGFPNGLPHAFSNEIVTHPCVHFSSSKSELIQLESPKAMQNLNGLSGAPCVVNNSIVGLISFQLTNAVSCLNHHGEALEKFPSLRTLYAYPIGLVAEGTRRNPESLTNQFAFGTDHQTITSLSERLFNCLQNDGSDSNRIQIPSLLSQLGFESNRINEFVRRNRNWILEYVSHDDALNGLAEFEPGIRTPQNPQGFSVVVGTKSTSRLGNMVAPINCPFLHVESISDLTRFNTDINLYGVKSRLRQLWVLRRVFIELERVERSSNVQKKVKLAQRSADKAEIFLIGDNSGNQRVQVLGKTPILPMPKSLEEL